MSLSANIQEKAALIWAIADKLTGVYKPHEYGLVILPMTVIKRFHDLFMCCRVSRKSVILGFLMVSVRNTKRWVGCV